MVEVAGGRAVVDFGTRRAHSPEAGVLAGRAAYIGGCVGTSNTETGFRYGIPVFGTAAHSWIQAFPTEREAFERLQNLLGDATVYLIDTYDTIEGAQAGGHRWAGRCGAFAWTAAIWWSFPARSARSSTTPGMPDAKIMATSDLNEYKILEFAAAGAPIDAFGVGTDLATSTDSPNLGVVYKLVELDGRVHRQIQRRQAHPARRQAGISIRRPRRGGMLLGVPGLRRRAKPRGARAAASGDAGRQAGGAACPKLTATRAVRRRIHPDVCPPRFAACSTPISNIAWSTARR